MKNKGKFKKEEKFHDEWAHSIKLNELMVDESFEACTSPENKYILKRLGNIRGKKILELGCGGGEASVYFAKKGAIVTATDISGGMLVVVKKLAKKHRVKVHTTQCRSDKIPFPDESFDIVYAANLLHHVKHEPTLKESHRVLKKGGVFISYDPLAHNPLINIYRRIAVKVRTDDETPLKIKDVKEFKKIFSKVEYNAFWFFTLWLFIRFYLIERVDPNKERYWKKILIEHKRLKKKYSRLERWDIVLFKIFPFMKRYCWNIVVVAKK
ncbi:MAG: class I SAM-dependent methyltransferase [Candidatus Woesearchaeota archaeon]